MSRFFCKIEHFEKLFWENPEKGDKGRAGALRETVAAARKGK
jgi:hypothetical protein